MKTTLLVIGTAMASAGLTAALLEESPLWGIVCGIGLVTMVVGLVLPAPDSASASPVMPPDESLERPDPGVLLATMSHEIRTPLNGVLGMVQLLLDTRVAREERRIVQTIYDSGQVLSQVVDDYLAYYRLESGGDLKTGDAPFDLEETVLGVALLFQGVAYDKGLDLVLYTGDDVPKVVRGDARRLSQIVANLLLNALKYTRDGEVSITLESANGEVEISISDTGPGIPAEELEQLFVPFRRSQSTSKGTLGSGLGLSISKRLAEGLGGRLEVESEVGAGTTFSAFLPLDIVVQASPQTEHDCGRVWIAGRPSGSLYNLMDVVDRLGLDVDIVESTDFRPSRDDLVFAFADPIGKSAASIAREQGATPVAVKWLSEPADDEEHVLIRPFGFTTVRQAITSISRGASHTSTVDRWSRSFAREHPLTIVVAEDDEVSARVLSGMLQKLGYASTVAPSGPAALELIEKTSPDVVLADLHMPGFGGVGLAERSDDASIWFIAMSASGAAPERSRARAAGMRDFLTKPFSVDALRGALLRAAGKQSSLIESSDTRPSLDQMRELFSGQPEAYAELVQSQIAQTDLLCKDIEEGVDSLEEDSAARLAAHTLRSSAAALGCTEVARVAKTLDLEWDTLEPGRRRELARRLITAWREVERDALKKELTSEG